MIGFVNDSNGQVNTFADNDTSHVLSELHARGKKNASTWAQLLRATGGLFGLPKCSYHLLYWQFSMQGAPVLASCPQEYRSIDEMDPESGIEQTLEYLTQHSAHKTLGHFKEPAGTQQMQFQ
jgi:hypothetical protein